MPSNRVTVVSSADVRYWEAMQRVVCVSCRPLNRRQQCLHNLTALCCFAMQVPISLRQWLNRSCCCSDTAGQAMATLRRVAAKQGMVVQRGLMDGLLQAARLHLRLAAPHQDGRWSFAGLKVVVCAFMLAQLPAWQLDGQAEATSARQTLITCYGCAPVYTTCLCLIGDPAWFQMCRSDSCISLATHAHACSLHAIQ